VQPTGTLPPADDLQPQAFEWVACSRDDDRFRNVVERGSLSWFPSTPFIIVFF
jgi:hypothetical protein